MSRLSPEEAEKRGIAAGSVSRRPPHGEGSPPDRIFLYHRNIEAICASEAEVRRQIRATLLHEVAHYFGLSEDELRGL